MRFRWRGSRMRVDSDIKLLRRILQNFLTNAFRYADGPVLLGVRRRKGELCLEVWDRGPGIAPDKQKVIFEGSSAWTATRPVPKGPGPGPGDCRRPVPRTGPSPERALLPGQGSVFSVCVPLARNQASAQQGAGRNRPALEWRTGAVRG